jgi:hypothetical protein
MTLDRPTMTDLARREVVNFGIRQGRPIHIYYFILPPFHLNVVSHGHGDYSINVLNSIPIRYRPTLPE